MHRYLVFSLVVILFSSCEKKTVPSREVAPTLSNDDLLYLMGGELFEVRTPADIGPQEYAGLAVRYSDGQFESIGSSTGWKPNETVKIVCFRAEKNWFRYAILSSGGNGSGEARFPSFQDWMPNSTRIGLASGDWLVRFSADNKIVISERAEGDDFDVVFHIEKNSLGEAADGKTPKAPKPPNYR